MGLSIDKLPKNLNSEINADLKRFQQQLVSALAAATPKDHGTASRGWQPGSLAVKDNKLTGQTIAYNNVPYIGALEAGHSSQAPKGFVQQTIAKLVK